MGATEVASKDPTDPVEILFESSGNLGGGGGGTTEAGEKATRTEAAATYILSADLILLSSLAFYKPAARFLAFFTEP